MGLVSEEERCVGDWKRVRENYLSWRLGSLSDEGEGKESIE